MSFGNKAFVVENNKIVVYPRAHKVNDIVEIIVKNGDSKTFVNKMVLCADHYLVDVARTINIKGTH